MSQYKTTNGRPASFKFGPVNIRIGKKPVEIDSKYADRIMKQYPGWIEKVGPADDDQDELVAEAAVTAETSGDDHQDAGVETQNLAPESAIERESENTTQETGATPEMAVDDQPKAVEPDPVPAETPTPAATPAKKAPTAKAGKKATSKA